MSGELRADTVGSLLRPDYLLRARAHLEGGEMAPADFKAIEDRAVDQVIAMQEGAGLDVVSDGEMRRHTFIDQLVEAVNGLTPDPAADHIPVPFHDESGAEQSMFKVPLSVTEKLRRRRMMTIEEYAYARAVARRPVKVTLPEPAHAVPRVVAGALTRGVRRPVRAVRRRSRADARGGRGAGTARLHLHPGRRAGLRAARRRIPAGGVGGGRNLRASA